MGEGPERHAPRRVRRVASERSSAVALLQSAAPPRRGARRAVDVGTIVDLDRSNGAPRPRLDRRARRAAVGAIARSHVPSAARAAVAPAALAGVLGAPDARRLVHDGPHPASATGWLVIAIVACAGAAPRAGRDVVRRAHAGHARRSPAACSSARSSSTRSTSSTSGSSASAAIRSPSTRSSRRRASSSSAGRSSRSRSGTRRSDGADAGAPVPTTRASRARAASRRRVA